MKKILFSIAALLASASISAQTVQLFKGETLVKEYTQEEVDRVVFKEAQEIVNPIDESKYHYDLYLTVGKHGGMSSKNTTLVRSIDGLDASKGVITITGIGTELGEYTMESISKDGYYYQIPSSADRFTKYQIKDNTVQVVQEQPFMENTFKPRNYAHAWLNDNTLILMSSDGENKKVIWTKLNTDDMTILSEGTLELPIDEGFSTITTSGLLAYRAADNKLFYTYHSKTVVGKKSTSAKKFHLVAINAADMTVEANNLSFEEAEEAGSAYGELMQNFTMFDKAGNLYFAAFQTVGDVEQGRLYRIKPGEINFDPTYNGFTNTDGKLLTVQYIGNGKAFAYSRTDSEGTAIDSYSHYYSVIDLKNCTSTRLTYNGKQLPYSGGRFSQRSVVVNGKVYFGINAENETNSQIYIYDALTGEVTKGAEVDGSHFFDMIRVVKN